MTNLHCTTDHHAVSPLNIHVRPVESGIIPDHFSTGWKTDPAHHDLSEWGFGPALRCRGERDQSGPDQPPLYFRPTYVLPDQGPLIADPFIFRERERARVDRLSDVNGPLENLYSK